MSRIETIAEGVTLYLGDCREIVPTLGKFDVVVTDPPYGIGWKRGINNARNSKADSGIRNDQDTSARDFILDIISAPAVAFGSFYAPFPKQTKQVLIWHKPPDSGLVGAVTGFRRDAEPIFLVGSWPVRTVKSSSVLTAPAQFRGHAAAETGGHPHSKPVDLMKKLIGMSPGKIVLDPFMGSGSTGVAAVKLGRSFIGIEIEEKHFDTACERIRAAYAAPDMFVESAPDVKQEVFEL